MGLLFYDRGCYEQAESFYRDALTLGRKQLGDDHPDVGLYLNNLGLVLYEGGRDEAELLFRQALAIRRIRLGEEHPDVAQTLRNLALFLLGKDDYAEAERLFQEALEVLRRRVGDKHPDTALALVELGRLRWTRGDYDAARPLYQQGLEIYRRQLGNQHPDTVRLLHHLARNAYGRGWISQAEVSLLEVAGLFEIARSRISFSGFERVEFSSDYSPFPLLSACQARSGRNIDAWHSVEANLARGLLDELTVRDARALNADEGQREQDLIRQIGKLGQQIVALLGTKEVTGKARAKAEGIRRERDALQAEFAQFEADLVGKYGVVAGKVYDLTNIQKQLSADAALLAWLDIKGEPKAADPNGDHWACVVRRAGKPVWVKLPGSGEGGAWTAQDDDLPEQVREAISQRGAKQAGQWRQFVRRLYDQRIAPVKRHLSGVHRLIVLPAGWMAGVPVEVLTNEYAVSYAPSGTIYAWLREERAKRTAKTEDGEFGRLLALGDPPFNNDQVAQMEREKQPDKSAQVLAMARGGSLDPETQTSIARGNMEKRGSLTRLAGTRYEVQQIAKCFEAPAAAAFVGDRGELAKHGAMVCLGSDASEQNLVKLVEEGKLREYRYIHFATHAIADSERPGNSSILLCQVGLPDAFEAAVAGKRIYDGALDVGEVLREWRGKLNAELVTLSACETALGKRSGGEGYLGFAQAFLLAGAQNLLLSLWNVDDAATTILMIRFYENVFNPSEPMSIADALAEAKQYVRQRTLADLIDSSKDMPEMSELRAEWDNRRKRRGGAFRPYEHPLYWAAFILIGEGGT